MCSRQPAGKPAECKAAPPGLPPHALLLGPYGCIPPGSVHPSLVLTPGRDGGGQEKERQEVSPFPSTQSYFQTTLALLCCLCCFKCDNGAIWLPRRCPGTGHLRILGWMMGVKCLRCSRDLPEMVLLAAMNEGGLVTVGPGVLGHDPLPSASRMRPPRCVSFCLCSSSHLAWPPLTTPVASSLAVSCLVFS